MLKWFGFYIGYFFILLLSWLPFAVLYLISDALAFILYYLIPYRKALVMKNLANAFPEKTTHERKQIAWRFYRHFSDVLVETIKLVSISSDGLSKRIEFIGFEVMEDLYKKDKSVAAVLGHYGNWEWTCILPLRLKHHPLTIYKPLRNQYFNRFMIGLRSKFGIEPVPMKQIYKTLVQYKNKNIITATGFIADQRPVRDTIQHWTTFLNQQTGVFTGIEKIAGRMDMAVVYFRMDKINRGRYRIEPVLLFENVSGIEPTAITETHLRYLESIIRAKPEYWLWSHRRWKHPKPTTHE